MSYNIVLDLSCDFWPIHTYLLRSMSTNDTRPIADYTLCPEGESAHTLALRTTHTGHYN